MLENCKTAKERWGGVSEIIDRWLQERQAMLVEYCELSGHKTFDENDRESCEQVERLCQILMDYVSAGHFEIYDQLIRESHELGDQEGLRQGEQLFAKVDTTTDPILDFNDKYQETDDLSTLPADLSQLGEVLATRFEAEDQMIAVLHMAHENLVA